MLDKSKPKILEYIEEIPDSRSQSSLNFQHPFSSIIFIALVCALCGADDWSEIELMACGMREWIEKFVPLPNGIPSHDTFGRVFGLIDPKAFDNFLIKWMGLLREKFSGDIVSFDGKTLCGTAEKGLGLQGVHILNAWSHSNGICIGHLKVEDKSNEITAMPKLIELLDIKGCIVTADALNTQKDVVVRIKEAEADYVLPVKENHPGLLEDIKLFFDEAIRKDFQGVDADHYETLDKEHGRVEKRVYHIIDGEDLPDKNYWPGVKSLGMVIRERTTGMETKCEISYYIASIEIDAQLFEKSVRGHWMVENGLHWRLDVAFREDESRYRDRVGAANLSALRKVAMGILSKEKSKKRSVKGKRLLAAVDPGYREHLLKNVL